MAGHIFELGIKEHPMKLFISFLAGAADNQSGVFSGRKRPARGDSFRLPQSL